MPLSAVLHITGAYSNAVLLAVMPHVSDCAKQLDLPIAQPITAAQVAKFNVSPFADNVGGGLWLTNRYWFAYSFGCVNGFRSPDNWFTIQDFENVGRFAGKDNMTTNEAIALARNSFAKLGYSVTNFNVNESPTEFERPKEVVKLGHIPFCRLIWKSPEATTREERAKSYSVQFDIDMQHKQVVGMSLAGTNFWGASPVIDVQTELESDYGKRIQSHTNAPAHLNTGKPPTILRKTQ